MKNTENFLLMLTEIKVSCYYHYQQLKGLTFLGKFFFLQYHGNIALLKGKDSLIMEFKVKTLIGK